MKKPEIKPSESNADLAGSEGQSTWVQGRNCVYHATDSACRYRVSIKTYAGWKSYGFFEDLEVAAYVANIAILAEDCEEQYQLNRVGKKDRQELLKWREAEANIVREKSARQKYQEVQAALEALRADEERQRKTLELEARKKAEGQRRKAEEEKDRLRAEQEQRESKEAEQLKSVPTSELLNLLQRDISGFQNRVIRAALEKRGFTKRAR